MKKFLLPVCILFFQVTMAQKLIRGVVLDSEKNKPIASASIFLSNTSTGTRADENGNFQINIPQGKFDLVISSIGYNTFSQSISGADTISFLSVHLSPRIDEMETVVIEPWLKDGWERYGKLFTDFFIGTTADAGKCNIRNPEVIRFRYSSKTKMLRAMATAPIIVENNSLGYTLQYQLESFEYNYESQYLIYLGYPFFVPMEGSAAKRKHWEKNRASAYFGSIMHFMRTIYINQLPQEGFEVRHLVRTPNIEKERVKSVYRNNYFSNRGATGKAVAVPGKSDSSSYYEKILKQPDYFEIVGREKLPGDSIAYAITEYKAGLYFPDYLLVIYTRKTAPYEYRIAHPDNGSSMMSRITLVHGMPLEIEALGNYYDPAELLSLGYWAWSEKISTMLPLDYGPEKGR